MFLFYTNIYRRVNSYILDSFKIPLTLPADLAKFTNRVAELWQGPDTLYRRPIQILISTAPSQMNYIIFYWSIPPDILSDTHVKPIKALEPLLFIHVAPPFIHENKWIKHIGCFASFTIAFTRVFGHHQSDRNTARCLLFYLLLFMTLRHLRTSRTFFYFHAYLMSRSSICYLN